MGRVFNVYCEDVEMIWCVGVITVGWLISAALNAWRLSSIERQWRRIMMEHGAQAEIVG